MKIKLWTVLGIVVLICMVVISGCTVAKIYGRGATSVMLNNPPQRVDVIEHFEVSKRITFDYTSAFDASEMLAKVLQETGCDAIINVGLEVKFTVGDFFLNLITLGIAQAKHLTVVGDAVRFTYGSSLNSENVEILAESNNLQNLTSMLMTMSEEDQSKQMIVRAGNGYRLVCLKEN